MSLFSRSKVEKVDLTRRFHLIGRVGQGSMSRVWRAEDKMSGKPIAVKVLDKEKTKRFEERFKGLNKPTEGDIAVSLQHPYIVKTHEVGWTLEDEMFLIMDYVEGSGLSLLVDLQSEDLRRYRIRLMIQIGEALSYFHKQNWIHRDICPRNIMITDDHQVRLIDFGLTVPNTADFRKPGNRTGTANYMAPELIKRRPTDQRIDVFSYAVTCYEMYARRHPWEAAQTLDAVMQHINQPPVPLTELVPRVDSEIAEVIMKGLEVDPDRRWSTVDEMVKRFREIEVRLVRETKEFLKRRQSGNGQPTSAKVTADGQTPAGPKLPHKPLDPVQEKTVSAKAAPAAQAAPLTDPSASSMELPAVRSTALSSEEADSTSSNDSDELLTAVDAPRKASPAADDFLPGSDDSDGDILALPDSDD
ncbi:MAG: serine/threonine-protein kinase [Planctomycetaceae bacterium]